MRVARVLLFLALSGAVAHADDAKPADPHPADAAPARAKIPLRVVRMLPETKQALLFGLGSALGFSLVLVLFAALRERLEGADVPAPFRGAPIALVTAGLMSLAFAGFAGLTR